MQIYRLINHVCVGGVHSSGSLAVQRSHWDIMASILRVVENADSKTHIMYKANLSYRQLERYLDLLLDKGLLKVVAVEHHSRPAELFAATDRGLSFLNAYHVLKEVLRKKKAP